ncbi:MAG: hypothetical protein ACOZAM_25855 [Pseudomonadota bacterium]
MLPVKAAIRAATLSDIFSLSTWRRRLRINAPILRARGLEIPFSFFVSGFFICNLWNLIGAGTEIRH